MHKNFTLLSLLMVFLVGTSSFGQRAAIKGTIVSEDGDPLPGVTITVKGATVGTVTDIDGNFSLEVPSGTSTLIFSYVGYLTEEVYIDGRSVINFQMSPDIKQLVGVVVTALGISREERSLGYATQEVEGGDLTFTKETNVLSALAGKVAGVQITGASGASMGGTQKIKIRGVNSLNGTDQPLIVIDGTPIANSNFSSEVGADYGNLAQDINTEDIESVNVLKGPAASALYGMRGQYGVIMITTKKGKKGDRISVELNSAVSIEKVGNIMPYQNIYGGGYSQEFSTLENGDRYVHLQADESWGPKMDGTPVRQFYSFYPQDPQYGELTPFVPHPDNIKDWFETGTNVNNGVTISGGSESTSYRFSVNDTRIQGVEPNTHLNRNNVGLSLTTDISKKLTASTNINYARNEAIRPHQGSEGGSRYFGQWFQRSIDMNRLKDYRYDDGTILHWNHRLNRITDDDPGHFINNDPAYWNNPYFIAYECTNSDNRDRVFGDIGLSYEVIEGLTLNGHIRMDTYTQNIEEIIAEGGTWTSDYTTQKAQRTDLNYELLAQYTKQWDEFSLDATLGANLYDMSYSSLYQSAEGGLSVPGYYDIKASIDRPTVESNRSNKQIRSGFALASFGYRSTFFLDASVRNDVSSTLPESNNSYWYPSASVSIVFSELLKWDPLSLGKVRASYAEVGSDLDPYRITPTYNVGNPYGNIVNLAVPNTLVNPEIKPAFVTSYEIGTDFSFINDRVGLNFTYYFQQNEDQIIPLSVSGTSGYTSAYINAGLIENKGMEISLKGSPMRSADFSWDIIFNVARNKNEIVELHPDIDVYNHDYNTYSSVTIYLNSYEGGSWGSIVGQAYQRDEATGMILIDEDNLPLYTDATHDFGTVLPDYTGGFQNVLSYKGFNLSAMIDFQSGGQFFSRSMSLAQRTGLAEVTAAINDNGVNVRDPLEDGGGVRVEGISAETGEHIVAYVAADDYYGLVPRRIYEENIYDASYVKLREVRFGHTWSKKNLGTLPFQSISLALILRNPAMIWQTAPKGLEPSEISQGSASGDTPVSWYEKGQLNTVRSYGLNLNVKF